MKNNSDMFAATGNPWVTRSGYVQEEQDAANPLCSTARRRSAMAYVEIRASDQKKHIICDFPSEPRTPKSQSQTARVLSIRKRIEEMARCEDAPVERPRAVYVPKAPDKPKQAADWKADPLGRKKYLNSFRTAMSPSRRAHVLFTYYSDIIRFYGSIGAFYA